MSFLKIIKLADKFKKYAFNVNDIHHSFIHKLSKIIGKNVSQENLKLWFEKNKLAIDDKLSNSWDHFYGYLISYINRNTDCRIYTNNTPPIDFNETQSFFYKAKSRFLIYGCTLVQ